MKKKDEQIERISDMEQYLQRAEKTLKRLEEEARQATITAHEAQALNHLLEALTNYLTSPQWREDFEADEAGQLPADLPRGVLSEDGIWNVLERARQLGRRN
ncbi:MAG: DUF4298 domain-containing protein [Alloprevotella sp.]|nr:DUF4298 domain-containing protein [Alloprevotella sp.]